MANVSVIVPVYRVEQYLPACVDSLLSQTCSDIQVILVDDGSPDNCGAICDAYAARDSRVQVIHKKNGGVSSARNEALAHANGRYVTFCDSDDTWDPDWLRQLVDAMEDNQADVAVGGFTMMHPDGRQVEVRHETGVYELDTEEQRLEYCFSKVLTPKHGYEIWTRLFRTDLIREHGIRFCETCGNYAEDLGFALSYSMFVGRAVSVENCGYRYTVRENSMTQTSVTRVKLGCLEEVYFSVEPYCRRAFSGLTAGKALPAFYFQLLAGQFIPKLWSAGLEPLALRKAAIESLRNWPVTEERLRRHLEGDSAWNPWYTGSYNAEVICHMRFLLEGNWSALRLQCKLIRMFRPMVDAYGKLRR